MWRNTWCSNCQCVRKFLAYPQCTLMNSSISMQKVEQTLICNLICANSAPYYCIITKYQRWIYKIFSLMMSCVSLIVDSPIRTAPLSALAIFQKHFTVTFAHFLGIKWKSADNNNNNRLRQNKVGAARSGEVLAATNGCIY